MARKTCVALAVLGLLTFASSAFAHDGSLSWDLPTMDQITENHYEDGITWKGYAYVTVKNSTSQAWGDFHFTIVNGPGVTIESSPAPSMTWPSYTYNLTAPNVLDYYFYSQPVQPGTSVTFTFYTDNTANQNAFFGVCGYPTPVPEPGSMLALGSGLFGMAGFLIRRKR